MFTILKCLFAFVNTSKFWFFSRAGNSTYGKFTEPILAFQIENNEVEMPVFNFNRVAKLLYHFSRSIWNSVCKIMCKKIIPNWLQFQALT